MRARLFTIGLCALLFPQAVGAQSLFDTYFKQAGEARANVIPYDQTANFIIEEMKTWQGTGIKITSADITAALSNDLPTLCNNKVNANDEPILFTWGTDAKGGSCIGLQNDIKSFVAAEQQTDQLADDLISIANGAELAAANVPHRPVEMGSLALYIKRIWAGTGAGLIPWNKDWKPQMDGLKNTLSGYGTDEKDKIVLRFQHGYFREQREADPRFAGLGDDVGSKLSDLASTIGVTGDATVVGEYATPELGVPNIGFWARKDDIGLLWIYPNHRVLLKRTRADEYPKMVPNGKTLAYPFEYEGGSPASNFFPRTPVCSRTVGRYGYLCRAMPVPAVECGTASDTDIKLVKCSEEVITTDPGPRVCPGFKNLFTDDGQPIVDPSNPAKLNPNLTPADTDKICDPEKKILYQDDISAHACYVDFCLRQSMNSHTLVPNRNTTLIDEATSPYLACVRRDPQLGKQMEIAHSLTYALPQYLGHLLTVDLDRTYCNQDGSPPHPLAGFCAFRSDKRSNSPSFVPVFGLIAATADSTNAKQAKTDIKSIATTIGERASMNQFVMIQSKVYGSLAQFIQQISDLILELNNAELTKTPCPWTGRFKSSSSSAP